jgi:bifunctional ADP-heptose synthase (sugar kinase/adenylyltransferase)
MDTQQQKQFKVLIVGDLCTDVYQYYTVKKISPEAPVPVLTRHKEQSYAGMAGNVTNNLIALGVNVDHIYGHSSTKIRLVDIKSKHQIARIDNDVISKPLTYLHRYDYDAIVFSDYDKGLITYDLIQDTRRRFKGPIFVDTKKTDLRRLEGCVVKINEPEYEKLETECSMLVVTRAAKPVKYMYQEFPVPQTEVVDVCGAGDTFLAALCFEYLNTNSIEKGIEFAIRASNITIKHYGVYAPTLKEINENIINRV